MPILGNPRHAHHTATVRTLDLCIYILQQILEKRNCHITKESTYTIIPIVKPSLRTILKSIPKKDPIPALKLLFRSLCENSNSNSVAPTIGPRNIPGILPTIKPTIPPRIAPNIPQLLPPNFLAPIAITILSAIVENTESTKSITNINGVIISNDPIQANMNTAIYTNHIPGNVSTVNITPEILSKARIM